MRLYLFLPTVALAGYIGSVWAGQIDCDKARTKVEKLICDDPGLLNQDGRLGEYFDKIVATAPKPMATQTKGSQREWIKSIRDKCESRECLANAYAARQKQLLESGIPEDVDENDPEDYCIKHDMPPGGAACMGYINSRGREERERKLSGTYKKLVSSLPEKSPILTELSTFQEKWTALRDKHCEKYGQANGGAASWNAVKESECRDEMADGQIEALEKLASCVAKNKECHVPKKIKLPRPDF